MDNACILLRLWNAFQHEEYSVAFVLSKHVENSTDGQAVSRIDKLKLETLLKFVGNT